MPTAKKLEMSIPIESIVSKYVTAFASPRDFLYHVSKQEIHCCSSLLYPKELFLSSSSKAKNYEYMVMQELA
jgi:hypothetical protein